MLTLAHPPKTSGQQKMIADENMIRGSGDWLAQLDSFIVLRPVTRERQDCETETITTRLLHVKPRSGPQAAPLLVRMTVTNDLTPLVTFALSATKAPTNSSADFDGVVKAAAGLFEEKKRLSRRSVVETLQVQDYGRPAAEAALTKLVELGVIHGPLTAEEKQRGERGHWYLFPESRSPSLSPPVAPDAAEPDRIDELGDFDALGDSDGA